MDSIFSEDDFARPYFSNVVIPAAVYNSVFPEPGENDSYFKREASRPSVKV
jgi:hypothetical protein